jgi:hypothetical protein
MDRIRFFFQKDLSGCLYERWARGREKSLRGDYHRIPKRKE